jgi:hypothetical protein
MAANEPPPASLARAYPRRLMVAAIRLWHVSAGTNRASILRHGLVVPRGRSRPSKDDYAGMPPRWVTSSRLFVYAWMEERDAHAWASKHCSDWYRGSTDLWQLDLPSDADVQLDQRDWSFQEGRHGVALISGGVPPDALTLAAARFQSAGAVAPGVGAETRRPGAVVSAATASGVEVVERPLPGILRYRQSCS